MDCGALAEIVRIEKSGVCSQCGAMKKASLAWDKSMGAIVRSEHCPEGHSHGMSWVFPEDATQAERDQLGLVEKKPKRKKAKR